MNKQKKLALARSIFIFVVFVSLGVIVVTEKASFLLIPKVQEKVDMYINNNYSSIKESLDINEVKYKNTVYEVKATSKKNKNHYFYIYYQNKKISDTYKNDYLNGKNLLTNIENKLKKEIKNKTSISCDIEILSTLDKYTSKVQERIINEEDLLELKFYTIKEEILIENWNAKEITAAINNLISNVSLNNITPKNYKVIITNKKDITESIEIANLTENFIINPYQEQIINDIIKNNNSKLLKENKIKYKYLN